MSKTLVKDQDNIPDWFIQEGHWLANAMRNFLKQGEEIAIRYTKAIDRDPTFHEFIKTQYPDIPTSYWRRMEKVGRGQLDMRILTGNAPYGNKLEKLSITEQRRALDDRLPLLLDNGDVLYVSVSDIRPRQADQLFSFDHIRDLPAQRAFLEEQRLPDSGARNNTKSVIVELDGDDFFVDGKEVSKKKLVSYIKTVLGG